MENACHNRGDFTATVVKVTGTEGHLGRGWSVCVCVGGGGGDVTVNGHLCIHVTFWSSCALLLPSTCACS